MKTNFDESKLTADQIHIGSKAREAFRCGENPPSWVEDEDKWAEAKEAALKSYDLDDDAYWPVVTHIYENMGGDISTALANGEKPGHEFRGNQYRPGDAADASKAAHKASLQAHATDTPEAHSAAAHLHQRALAAHEHDAGLADKRGDPASATYHRDEAEHHRIMTAFHADAAKRAAGRDAAEKEADRREALQNARETLVIANDAAIDSDGWALAAPFGEHPKTRKILQNGRIIEQRFLQVLDNEAADALVSKENGIFRKLRRAIVGIPIYKGHADLADYAPETLGNEGLKKDVIGLVDGVRKGERGIELHFSLTPAGAAAVENEGCKWPSVLWLVMPNNKDGVPDSQGRIVVRPFKLLSAALTPYPNISGVESLANASGAGSANTTEPDMKLLAGWLLAQGAVLANAETPTEMQVLEAFKTLHTSQAGQVTTLGNEKSTLAGKITTLENEKAQEKKRADEAATALANETTARKAERRGRAETVTDLAIARGKLAIAGRGAQITALENAADFDAAAKDLLTSATKFRMIGDAQSGKVLANETDDVTAEYNKQFGEALKASGGDPVKAHAAVMKLPGLAEKLAPKKPA
jgi:hypothetical protein